MEALTVPISQFHISITLDTDLKLRLKSLAQEDNRTPHFLIKQAITSYVQGREKNRVLMKSLDDAAAHFEATGLHVTHEEVGAWIEQLQVNRNAKPPVCHL
jgi:predicted transcriptional regulator